MDFVLGIISHFYIDMEFRRDRQIEIGLKENLCVSGGGKVFSENQIK